MFGPKRGKYKEAEGKWKIISFMVCIHQILLGR